MSATPQTRACRFEDYWRLPEDGTWLHELAQGALVLVPPPTAWHQCVSSNLVWLLERHVRAHAAGRVLSAPVGVVLGEGEGRDVLLPDALFVSRAREAIISPRAVEGAPDLVVEILSPATRGRDLGCKREAYARHGVQEYWVVDPEAETVDVRLAARLTAPGTPARFAPPERLARGATLRSVLLPGLAIALEEIFAGRPG